MKYFDETKKGLCIYNAGPWFRPDQEERNTFMKETLEKLGFNVFDPRTANLVPPDANTDWRKTAFEGNIGAIREADCVIATTDGLDAGTMMEAGVAYQAGIPIIYFAETLGDKQFNLMLAQSGIHVVLSREQLVKDLQNPELLKCIVENKVFSEYSGNIE